ncbi:MAG: sulfate adenylyltransferase subunit CysN [Pseudomonadota bacterium]|nr:sulfate adenylyltransferase subunit CysN [Pseudomonadota bacterium]
MSDQDLLKTDFDAYLARQAQKDTLRFITCGSVDDGKSTLIGRLLHEARLIFDDQLAALDADSRKFGTQDGDVDFALLVDGLAAEREQGITIDVAYRYFTTDRRKFVVADTPGHEQYTRNMATGASTASLAIIMVDARKGVLAQTRRHAFIASLLGIRHVVLAVNKMDLADYAQDVFDGITEDFHALNEQLGFEGIQPIPVSALKGDNILAVSGNMPWYSGPALMTHLEEVDVSGGPDGPLRLPVQYVIRPNQDFRGYAGRVAGGRVSKGDRVKILPSGQEAGIESILLGDERVGHAAAGQSVTVTIDGDLDISRGDMIVAADEPAEIADQFRATIIWMNEAEMLPGRRYILKTEGRSATATMARPRYRVNVNSYERQSADTLCLNDIANCNISLDRPIAFDPYQANRTTGSFILIDPDTNATAAAGIIEFALRRSQNIHWQTMDVDKNQRAGAKGQKACVLWFTGLSGSGKSTIANIVEKKLHAMGRHTMLLDGDNVRHGLNRDLGFTDADRVENIRRIGEVSKLMVEAGMITLVSFISPFASEREMARAMLEEGEFIEIYVDTPLEEAERRDVKGLYKKARAGELKNFTGIDSPYEAPANPEIRVNTVELSPEEAADRIIRHMGFGIDG